MPLPLASILQCPSYLVTVQVTDPVTFLLEMAGHCDTQLVIVIHMARTNPRQPRTLSLYSTSSPMTISGPEASGPDTLILISACRHNKSVSKSEYPFSVSPCNSTPPPASHSGEITSANYHAYLEKFFKA